MANDRIQYEAYGVWKVTTEGDCEGRSVTQLGTHEGFIDEIALALANRVGYSLTFKQDSVKELDMTPKKKEVNIQLDINSGTWDMSPENRVKYFQDMFARAGRAKKINVVNGQYFASVKIKTTKTLSEAEVMAKKLVDAGFDPIEVINHLKQQ